MMLEHGGRLNAAIKRWGIPRQQWLDLSTGINPISWMNDDLPELGGETPLETALSEGRQIGYAGFELGNKFPKTGAALKAKLAEYGLACVSGWYSGFLAEDTLEAELGVPVIDPTQAAVAMAIGTVCFGAKS